MLHVNRSLMRYPVKFCVLVDKLIQGGVWIGRGRNLGIFVTYRLSKAVK